MRHPAVLALTLVLALAAALGAVPGFGGAQDGTPVSDPDDELPQYRGRGYDKDRRTMSVVLGQTALAGVRSAERLVLVHIRLTDGAVSDRVENSDTEVLTVDTGPVVFTFTALEGEARFIQGQPGQRCSGGCALQAVLDQNRSIRLEPGDTLTHSGRVAYTYRLPDSPSARMAPNFGSAALPAAGCSGGCRGRLTVACTGVCNY